MDALQIFTVGHSTRSAEEFTDLLRAHEIAQVADVRTVPKSSHNPQFWGAALEASLAAAGIGYRWFPQLGGLRKTSADSPNGAWRNASFRGYADYMLTPEFAAGLAQLLDYAAQAPTAIMCAEAVPWRCHRSLIGDALLLQGHEVYDIMSPTKATPEKLTSFAVVTDGVLTYPPDDGTETRA
ncbi:DUF488 family protein [Corynebacterium nasicanis]|uniref:DUF488 family protein n=1 Tax=Corynebacterium nasicanis TaxID=1448267 RepID=A0ABW1QCT6_9CORY